MSVSQPTEPQPLLENWTPDGAIDSVSVRIFHTFPSDGLSHDPLLLIHGIGEGERSSVRSLEFLASKGIAAASVVMPYNHDGLRRDDNLPNALRQVAVEVPRFAARRVLQLPGVQAEKVRAVGRSGGALSLMLAAAESDTAGECLIGDFALVAAIGIGMSAIGTTELERQQIMRQRLRKNMTRQARQPSNWGGEILKNIRELDKRRLLGPSLRTVTTEDATDTVVSTAANNRTVGLLLGEHDIVQTPTEQLSALSGYPGHKLHIEVTAGGHATSASRLGLAQLLQAIRLLERTA